MKKQRIIILMILILALVAATSALITAWLTDTKQTGPTTFTVGDIEFEWEGAITTSQPIVPGQELIASAYQLVNTSTVTSQLRVIFTITASLDETPLTNPEQYFISTNLAAGWVYNSTDEMWYYASFVDEVLTPTTIPIPTEGNDTIPVLTTLKLDGTKAGNDISNYEFTITFVFQAKQNDYVTWADLGSATFNFGSGLEDD
jgi:hypothetical protein